MRDAEQRARVMMRKARKSVYKNQQENMLCTVPPSVYMRHGPVVVVIELVVGYERVHTRYEVQQVRVRART